MRVRSALCAAVVLCLLGGCSATPSAGTGRMATSGTALPPSCPSTGDAPVARARVGQVPGLDQRLVPDARPRLAVVCRYTRPRPVRRLLGADAAAGLARAAEAVRLQPLVQGALYHCPADFGEVDVVVLRYDAGDVVLRMRESGCQTISNDDLVTFGAVGLVEALPSR